MPNLKLPIQNLLKYSNRSVYSYSKPFHVGQAPLGQAPLGQAPLGQAPLGPFRFLNLPIIFIFFINENIFFPCGNLIRVLLIRMHVLPIFCHGRRPDFVAPLN
jgi:hypothetical protein